MNALPNVIAPSDSAGEKHSTGRRSTWREWGAAALAIPMAEPKGQAAQWDGYVYQQLQGLIHRVFFPGWPKPAHQVVLMATDERTDTATICAQLARAMASQLPGKICAVEASRGLYRLLENADAPAQPLANSCDVARAPLRQAQGRLSPATPVGKNLWLLPAEALFPEETNVELNLQSRISELRREFEYVLLRAPAAQPARAALMGSLTDGVLLVVQANVTRRAAAARMVEMIHAANARLLGVILAGRTFPIPEAIYEWL